LDDSLIVAFFIVLILIIELRIVKDDHNMVYIA